MLSKELEEALPEEWPVLEAGDFCRGSLTEGERHCTIGWMCVALSRPPISKSCIPLGVLDEVRQLSSQYCTFAGIGEGFQGTVSTWNDDLGTPFETLASTWNAFGRELGYTEVVEC